MEQSACSLFLQYKAKHSTGKLLNVSKLAKKEEDN